ncbi:hypothetical protein TNCV_661411 [Trichonephila clavipes]|nr:hypothetical protein TNCV_661411 [Trichonephila clavipes]
MTPTQTYDSDCLLPTVKHGVGRVTIWPTMSWFSAGLIVTLKRRITRGDSKIVEQTLKGGSACNGRPMPSISVRGLEGRLAIFKTTSIYSQLSTTTQIQ